MRSGLSLLVLVGVTSIFVARAGEPVSEQARAATLVARLGSDDYQTRQEAAQAIERLGAAALPALRAALKHPDAEVHRRAGELLAGLEIRMETSRFLDTPRLRLQYKNTPLAEVLDDLSKRSGNPVKLDSSREEVLRRPITLKGEWTFWEALSRICEVAGLAEPEPEPSPPVQAPQVEESFRGRRRMIVLESSRSTARSAPEVETITLHDLPPTARPTFQMGALRIRVFGPRVAGPVDKDLPTQHVPLTLEIKPEPRIGWEKLAALRIDRVIDERGQVLKLPPAVLGDVKMPDYGDDVMILWDGWSNQPLPPAPQRLALQFPVNNNSGTRLREIHGVVAGWIRTPPEALITIDQLAKVPNETRTGPGGCRLKVVECKRDDDDLYQVQLHLTPPHAPSMMDLFQGRMFRVNRRFVEKVTEEVKAATLPFELSNEKGEPLGFVNGMCEYDTNGTSRVYTLTYRPNKNDQGPAKLVYRDRRSAFVEVPFTIKDVPLYKGK